MMKHTFDAYRNGYAEIWANARVLDFRRAAVSDSAARIVRNRERYAAVEKATGVPWFVVGIIHKMEANLSFAKHLHNGDPLTARTRQVPRGRPTSGSPPFTWEESAIDALKYDGLDKVTEWTVERIAYELEKFNGFGYRRFGIPSPYLWSFTTAYVRGKYVADGRWDASAVSQQSGGMALLRVLNDTCRLGLNAGAYTLADVDESEQLATTPTPAGTLANSRTVFGTIVAAIGATVYKTAELFQGVFGDVAGVVADVATESGSIASSLTQLAGILGMSLPWIGGAAVGYGLAIVLHARVSAHFTGKVG